MWPAESAFNDSKESIVIGFISSGGNITGDARANIFNDPQSAYFSDGALSAAIAEINNRTDILPNHRVSLCGNSFLYTMINFV